MVIAPQRQSGLRQFLKRNYPRNIDDLVPEFKRIRKNHKKGDFEEKVETLNELTKRIGKQEKRNDFTSRLK